MTPTTHAKKTKSSKAKPAKDPFMRTEAATKRSTERDILRLIRMARADLARLSDHATTIEDEGSASGVLDREGGLRLLDAIRDIETAISEADWALETVALEIRRA
jgi:hypothetical protein